MAKVLMAYAAIVPRPVARVLAALHKSCNW
jgi:hypothetical protein